MNRDDEAKRNARAHLSILEGRAMLLRESIESAIRCDRTHDVRKEILNLFSSAREIADALGVALEED